MIGPAQPSSSPFRFIEGPRFDTADEADNWCISWLHKRGFVITKPSKVARLTPKELRALHAPHLGPAAFHARLAHPACPLFAAEKGPSGRLTYIAPTPALIEWLSRPAMPGVGGGRPWRKAKEAVC